MAFPPVILEKLGISAPGNLLCLVDHPTPGDFELVESAATVLAFPYVEQDPAAPIYNTSTGVFTIPSAGLYCFSVNITVQLAAALGFGGLQLNRNSTDEIQLCTLSTNPAVTSGTAAGSFIFAANEGDQISLNIYINGTDTGATLWTDYASFLNKIRLFKL